MVLVNIISMKSALENINLDISLMLISWGFMTGKYQDGVINVNYFFMSASAGPVMIQFLIFKRS